MSEIPVELAERIPDAAGQTLTAEHVRERQRLRDIGPDREYVQRKFARYRKPVLDARGRRVKDPRTGEDKTEMSIPLREPDGKPTRAAVEMMAVFGPQMRAEVEARNNREKYWHGKVRFQGSHVERGEGGMLWRYVGGSWMPLGVHCLGIPIAGDARVPRDGIQHSPDGIAYWWRGEWVPVDDQDDD